MAKWLPNVKIVDLRRSRGNGPFNKSNRKPLGCILHVNVDRKGTSDSFWRTNSRSVTPNVQIYKGPKLGNAGGKITHQMLPLNWQPWCQKEGNFHYAAIETAGYPDEPLTDAQLSECARVYAAGHRELGWKLALANKPGEKGLGTHKMGGAPYGGHECPGRIRTKQRAEIIRLAKRRIRPMAPPKPKPQPVASKPKPSGKPAKAPKFPLRAGHYFGDIDGPARSHGGINRFEINNVKGIEKRLKQLGWYSGPITGIFDRGNTHRLEDAVQQFQHASNIKTTGDVGRKTWAALFSASAKKKG